MEVGMGKATRPAQAERPTINKSTDITQIFKVNPYTGKRDALAYESRSCGGIEVTRPYFDILSTHSRGVTMAITALSRWKGSREDIMRIAGKIKPIIEGHGAEYMRVGMIYSGAHAGQWAVAIRYADWTSFGKAQEAASSDDEYLATYAEAVKVGELMGRSIIVGVLE